MVKTIENFSELSLMFSKALTLATSDTNSDPSLGNGSYLELDVF